MCCVVFLIKLAQNMNQVTGCREKRTECVSSLRSEECIEQIGNYEL